MQKKIVQFQKTDAGAFYVLTDDGKLYVRGTDAPKNRYDNSTYKWEEVKYPFPKDTDTKSVKVVFDTDYPKNRGFDRVLAEAEEMP